MIHKIAYPVLIIIILFLGVFAYIKASEAELQTILAMESVVRAERASITAQESSSRAAEAAAQAQLEAEKQRAIAMVYEEQSKLNISDVVLAAEYKMEVEKQGARVDQAMRLKAETRKSLLAAQKEAEIQRSLAQQAAQHAQHAQRAQE